MQSDSTNDGYKKAVKYVGSIIQLKETQQFNRYEKMSGEAKRIATVGILRRLRQSNRGKLLPAKEMALLIDKDTIREIITDANDGNAVFKSVNDDKASDFRSSKSKPHRYRS